MTSEKSREMAKLAFKAMDDKKAENIKIIDISELTPIADYFAICTASNHSQLEAVVDNICEALGRAGFEGRKTEGAHSNEWILMDYNDIVIHVFSREGRSFYDLERIWRDGKFVSADEL